MKTFLTIAGVLAVVLAGILISTLRFESQSFAQDVAHSSPYQIVQAPPVAVQPSFNQPFPAANYSDITLASPNTSGSFRLVHQPGQPVQAIPIPGPSQFGPQPVVQKQIVNSQPNKIAADRFATSNPPTPQNAKFQQNTRPVLGSSNGFGSVSGSTFTPKSNQGFNTPPVAGPIRSKTFTTSTNRSSWPSNANNVKTLVRTEYTLPAKAAESIVMFFSIEGTDKIETKIDADSKTKLVKLIVTTDQKTQLAIAHFLDAVYPKSRIEDLKKAAEEQSELAPEKVGDLPKATAVETNFDKNAPATNASSSEVLDKLLDEIDGPKRTEPIDEER